MLRAEGGLGSPARLPPSLRGFALGRAGGTGAGCGAAVRGGSGAEGGGGCGRDASAGAARLSGQRRPRAAPRSPRRPHGGTGTAAQPSGGGHRRAPSPARKCPGRGGGGEAGREGEREAPRAPPGARAVSAAAPRLPPGPSTPERAGVPAAAEPRVPAELPGRAVALLAFPVSVKEFRAAARRLAVPCLLSTRAPLPSPSQRGRSIHASAQAFAPAFS